MPKIRIGGLLRCCIESIDKHGVDDPEEGAVMNCEYCSDSVIFRHGAWEWNRISE